MRRTKARINNPGRHFFESVHCTMSSAKDTYDVCKEYSENRRSTRDKCNDIALACEAIGKFLFS